MKADVRVFVALSLGVASPCLARAQGAGKTLDEIYKDESHCLVAPEIRSEKDKAISCYCRDALTDARYVYQTYLIAGKDQNLGGAYLTLESNATRLCGEGYGVIRAAQDADWRWSGPEVIRRYPSDREIERLKPDRNGWRTVEYKVDLAYRDPRGRQVTRVESFTALDRFPPKGSK